MVKRIGLIALSAFLLLLSSCRTQTPAVPSQETEAFDFVKAVWMPYFEVDSLLSSGVPAQARQAIAACMSDCVSRGINTVYFHVRANSDACYASSLYPVTDTAAVLLSQGFDPLACAVEEAHRLGLELHAWVNPYRIGADASRAQTDGIFEVDGRWYYDPSADSTKALVINGVRELVQGYDIDGVQFDDYFYPSGVVAPDAAASFERERFLQYRSAGGALSVADWRRMQVSSLMASVYSVCHLRDGCVFGVSPSYNITEDRETMYADVELWAKTTGYVDYLCPQLYVGFQHEYAPFEEALAAWEALECARSVSLVAGLALYKTGMTQDAYAGSGSGEWASGGDIIARQLSAVQAAGWQGAAVYSHLSFEAGDDRDVAVVTSECRALCKAWCEL